MLLQLRIIFIQLSGQLQHIQLFYVSACLRPVPWQNQSSMHIRRKQEYGICSSAERFFKNKDKISIICFSLAGICGVPVYLLTKAGLGTDVAATLMIIVMLPFFFFAMYEKDGFPAEKILLHIIRQKFLRPGIRVYRSQNLYDRIIEYDKLEKEGAWLEKKAKEAREARNPFHFLKKADRKK